MRAHRMNFGEYLELIAAAILGACVASFRYFYNRIAMRPMMEALSERLDKIEAEMSELALITHENATRLEERK